MPLTISIFILQAISLQTWDMDFNLSQVTREHTDRMNRDLSPIINFDAVLIRDLSRINTYRYFALWITNPCIGFPNRYEFQTIDYSDWAICSKTDAHCQIKANTNCRQDVRSPCDRFSYRPNPRRSLDIYQKKLVKS